MRRKNRFRIVILCLLAALLLCACGSQTEEKSQSVSGPVQEGDTYRDFTVPLADGGSFTLSEQEGKVVLLNFWATWCGPCVGELPAFPRLIERYGDKLSLIAVNSGESEVEVRQFLKANGYTFPVGLDPKGTVSNLYPTDGIPYTLVIGPDGKVAHIQLGAEDADSMYNAYAKMIDGLLN